jgi:hypothetical protein
MVRSFAKARLSFLLAAGGGWCAACGGNSSAIFSDIPAENGASSAIAGSDGSAAGLTGLGGSLASGGSESAGGSAASGGTSEQGGTSAASGGAESEAGRGSAGTSGQGSGGGGGGTTGNGGSGGTGDTAGSAGTTASAGTASGGGSGGSGGGVNGAPCPNVSGDYTITDAEGNCQGLNTDATQSIAGGAPQCLAYFVSLPQEGGRGINGAGALDATGAFKGAVLSLNNTQRTNCTGDWDAVNERMTVKCGGLDELCTVVLERN